VGPGWQRHNFTNLTAFGRKKLNRTSSKFLNVKGLNTEAGRHVLTLPYTVYDPSIKLAVLTERRVSVDRERRVSVDKS